MAAHVLETPGTGRLATPVDRPDADIVIYDGHCRICTAQIRKLARWDTRGRLAYVSLHDPLVASRFPDLSYDDMMRQMYVVDVHGGRHGGVDAVRYLSRRLPRLWPLVPILYFPGTMPLWRFLYRQVAAARYRFGKTDCDDGSCQLHAGR